MACKNGCFKGPSFKEDFLSREEITILKQKFQNFLFISNKNLFYWKQMFYSKDLFSLNFIVADIKHIKIQEFLFLLASREHA